MGQRSASMKRRRHTPEQIVRQLREADRLLGEGQELPEVVKLLEVSEATFHRWRAQYGGMKADGVKRLKELGAENAKLKRIVADQLLDIEGLRELSRGRMKVKPSRGFVVGVASRRSCARRRLVRVRRSGVRSLVAARGWDRVGRRRFAAGVAGFELGGADLLGQGCGQGCRRSPVRG
jgi:putative transposase